MIVFEHVSKTIKGHEILKDLNYTFDDKKIYGLYGPNGSGKTMILRLACGLVRPTSGKIMINGEQLGKDFAFPPSVGVVIENMELLPHLTAFENLKELGSIKSIVSDDEIREALERVGLLTDKTVKKFSLGMKQRLNIAQAIFEHPDIILLDEPTNALDEDGVESIYKILEEEKARGACIVIASHNKNDFKRIVDQVIKVENETMVNVCE